MNISRLRAQNFKSFDTVDVELGDFNVLIGANASGKSNFLSLLTFLRDIAREGVEDAVSMQSGEIDLLRNVQIGSAQPTKICFESGYGLDDPGAPPGLGWGGPWALELGAERITTSGFRYRVGLQHRESDFQISEEEISWGYFEGKEGFDESTFQVEVNDRKLLSQQNDRSSANGVPSGFPEKEKMSLLRLEEKPWLIFTRQQLLGWQVYNFDFHRSGSVSSSQKGKTQLEESGSNVALVLRHLLKDEEKRRKFLNLAATLLPFVEDLDVERLGGQSLLMTLQESHAEGQYLPSSLLSEGTIRVVALLIALYFENKWVMAFEEPATSLHPKLISRLMQMMKEVSEDKQIFMTTHNPEVIKHVNLDDVYLVSRDENGFSQVTKPADKKEVRIFLENDLGIDELFVQNLL